MKTIKKSNPSKLIKYEGLATNRGRNQNERIFLRRYHYIATIQVHGKPHSCKICHFYWVFTSFLEPVNGHIFFQFFSREHRICLLDPFRSTDRQHGSIDEEIFVPIHYSHVKVMKKLWILPPFSPFSTNRRHLGYSIFVRLFFSV